jgi:hypothetical protein
VAILDHFPGTPREGQAYGLQFLEENWSRYNVFALVAPVASGKSRIARCLSSWLASRGTKSAILTPTNVLVRQYADEFPELPTLGKRDSYSGPTAFGSARSKAEEAQELLANYYTYVGNRLFRNTIIVDEAHNILPMLQERWAKKLWQRDWGFPDDLHTVEDFVLWAETASLPEKQQRQLDKIVEGVARDENYILDMTEGLYRGEVEPVLLLKPLTVRDLKPWMWNFKVQKIVLMSATLSEWELFELGLDRRRVAQVEIESSIPPANRLVVLNPVADMAWANRQHSTPKIAEYLHKLLQTRPEKGLIHVTYDVAARLRGLLSHERLIWHTRDPRDRQSQYAKFRASGDGVMVASGMSEGIDLAYDAARWQVMCQVPYPSLADAAVRRKAEAQPDWFQWETVKATMQTIGRVCRAPDDYGVTEILDAQAPDFFRRSRKLWPEHVLSSIKWPIV